MTTPIPPVASITPVNAVTRAAIDDVNARWAWAIDSGEPDMLRSILTPDVTWVGHGGTLEGVEAVVSYFHGRGGGRTTRHGSGLHLLTHVDDYTVHGKSTWYNFASNDSPPGPPVVYLVADFDDVYVRVDDERWSLQKRVITPVFRDATRAPANSRLNVEPNSYPTGG